MSQKLFSLSSLFERKKPLKERIEEDELAIVKAAAWAWYQHGSGFEGKSISEFDVTRTQRAPRPSRYKLEAMRIANEAKEEFQVHNKESLSLLDKYEVQSISKLVDSGHNRICNSNNSNGKRRMKKKISKGFWSRHGVMCGGGNDVVDANTMRRGGLSAKGVPVVNLAKCLPRTNSAL